MIKIKYFVIVFLFLAACAPNRTVSTILEKDSARQQDTLMEILEGRVYAIAFFSQSYDNTISNDATTLKFGELLVVGDTLVGRVWNAHVTLPKPNSVARIQDYEQKRTDDGNIEISFSTKERFCERKPGKRVHYRIVVRSRDDVEVYLNGAHYRGCLRLFH